MDTIMQLKGINKSFQAVHALVNIDLDIYTGETLGLVGENGAGKSTLVKILTGAHEFDSGEVIFEGKPVQIRGPLHAKNMGISQAYQRAEYVPALTVAENIFLGEEDYAKHGFVSIQAMIVESQKVLEQYGIAIDARTRMNRLSVAECQLVTIVKMLRRKPKLIIFDEPTAVLSDNEVGTLFQIIRQLQREHVTIIYISHRLDEVFKIANRIAVMRDGYMITVLENKNITHENLIEHMLGRKLGMMFPQKNVCGTNQEILRVEKLNNKNIKDISFSMRKGEILCIIGLVGSKRTELVRAIYGVDRLDSGSICVDGKPVVIHSPRAAIGKGIFLAPEDRKGMGIVPERPISENITYSNLKQFFHLGYVRQKNETKYAEDLKAQIKIKAPTIRTLCSELSGGNQQKVIVAKALTSDPKVLIVDEPTQGIDVGAKAEIYQLIHEMVDRGVSILMITSETEEALGLANRILVMREGRIAGELMEATMNTKTIISLMYGSGINDKQ